MKLCLKPWAGFLRAVAVTERSQRLRRGYAASLFPLLNLRASDDNAFYEK